MNLTRALICLPVLFAMNGQAATNTPAIPDAATAAAPDAHLAYPPGKAPKFWSVATAETIMARWPDYNLAYHAGRINMRSATRTNDPEPAGRLWNSLRLGTLSPAPWDFPL